MSENPFIEWWQRSSSARRVAVLITLSYWIVSLFDEDVTIAGGLGLAGFLGLMSGVLSYGAFNRLKDRPNR